MSEYTPKVSIVLPTYNGGRYIRQSIQSCLNQTYRHFELIIVDDGSTDATPEIIHSIRDPRIRYVRQSQNLGHIKALNKGFALASGEFLTWTSDDNYYTHNAIEVMLTALLKSEKIDFVYADYHVVDANDLYLRNGRVENPGALDVDNCVGGCFLYRRQVYETVGDFHEEAFLAEDYEYWLRVREKFRMKKMDEALYNYRMHEESLTGKHKEAKVQAQVEIIRDWFIRPWKKHYLRAKKNYYNGDLEDAKQEILSSLRGNLWYVSSWRLIALLCLDRRFVAWVRRVKRFLKP